MPPPSDSSSRLRTSATLEPPTCSPSTAVASVFASSTIRSRSFSRPPRTTKSAACARAPHSSISAERAPGADRPDSETRGVGSDLGRHVTRLDRQSLALGLERGLVPHERFEALPHRRHRGGSVLCGHGRPPHRALRRHPGVLPGAPGASGLLEPVLGVGELLPRLRLAGARVALRPLGLLDLCRDRLERAAHPACPPSDVVDPAQQADDIVEQRRDGEIAPFELAHVCDEVGGAIVGHAPSIAER